MTKTEVATQAVLVVDDYDQMRDMMERTLDRAGFECVSAASADQAKYLLGERAFDALVTDVSMPGDASADLLALARHLSPDMAVVMVAGVDDPELAGRALEADVLGYLLKPFRPTELLVTVRTALRRKSAELAAASRRELLERRIDEQTFEIDIQRASVDAAHTDLIRRLQRMLGYREVETAGHSERVAGYCGLIAERIGLDAVLISEASRVHDVGKVAIPDSILRKPGPLAPWERAEMERHTVIGHQIVAGSSVPLLQTAASVALTHHERWDGGGYPNGLAEAGIPIEGRIVAIADTFDALTSDRPYRAAMPLDTALGLMTEVSGRQLDPALFDVFIRNGSAVEEIYRTFKGL